MVMAILYCVIKGNGQFEIILKGVGFTSRGKLVLKSGV